MIQRGYSAFYLAPQAIPWSNKGRLTLTWAIHPPIVRTVLTSGALSKEQLLISEPKSPTNRLIDWSFTGEDGEQPAPKTAWLRREKPKSPSGIPSGTLAAVTDFCHALLTSNEFLYLH